jgi:hypothetical protein
VWGIVIAALVLCAAGRAAADVRWHGSMGAGGALAWNGPRLGAWAGVELWPASLWGVRGDAIYFPDGDVFLTASIARQLGGTRPHLAIAVHLGGGVDLGDPSAGLVSAGLSAQLQIKGPLAIGLDASVYAQVAGDRFSLSLVSTLAGLLAF